MVWSEAKDYIMLKEVAAEGVFDSKLNLGVGQRHANTRRHQDKTQEMFNTEIEFQKGLHNYRGNFTSTLPKANALLKAKNVRFAQ